VAVGDDGLFPADPEPEPEPDEHPAALTPTISANETTAMLRGRAMATALPDSALGPPADRTVHGTDARRQSVNALARQG
jgi:hypothetical protein